MGARIDGARRARVIGLSLLCGVAIGLAVAIAFREEGPKGPPLRGPTFPPGLRAASFTLPDQDGRPVSLRDYRGAVVVLTFPSTACPDACATVTREIRGALDTLGRDPAVLAISVDPAHDTPPRARAFLRRVRMRGRMRFLLGDEALLRRTWAAYAIAPEHGAEDATPFVYLVDRVGRLRVGYPPTRLDADDLAHDISLLGRERFRTAR